MRCRECGGHSGLLFTLCGDCSSTLEKEAHLPHASNQKREQDRIREVEERLHKLAVTTAPNLEGFTIVRTLDVITAECVFGMNIFRDLFASASDILGGRSAATQNVLRDARRTCLDELKTEALKLGANAVIAIDLDYSEISGQGKSMLFLVASGTAVVVEPKVSYSLSHNGDLGDVSRP